MELGFTILKWAGSSSTALGGPTGPQGPRGSEPPSDNEGDGGGGRRRDRNRVKEADEVRILSFPSGTAWRPWRASTIHAIVSAAGRHDDSALEWVMKVETHRTVDLGTPGDGLVTLDRTLAAALAKISHGELGRQSALTSNAALSCGQVARGRVLLALVFEYYSAGRDAMVMFDVNHIQRKTLKGDNLESFQNTRAMARSELATTPEPAILQCCYFRQIQNSGHWLMILPTTRGPGSPPMRPTIHLMFSSTQQIDTSA